MGRRRLACRFVLSRMCNISRSKDKDLQEVMHPFTNIFRIFAQKSGSISQQQGMPTPAYNTIIERTGTRKPSEPVGRIIFICMKKKYLKILSVAFAAAALSACNSDNGKQEAEALLEQASDLFEQGLYDKARHVIDSLRTTYPHVIETRKKALVLYQSIALKQAQNELAVTDILLQQTEAEYAVWEEKLKAGKVTPETEQEAAREITRLRLRRDSLRIQFDTQGAKIRYIHRRQKE